MSSSPISTRPAQNTDIQSIIHLLTQAFWNEDAVGRFLHPHRHRFPDDVSKYWRRGLRETWWERGREHVVVVDGEGVVVGYAGWVFVGDPKPIPIIQTIISTLFTFYAKIQNHLSNALSPNRAANPEHLTAMARAKPFYQHKLPAAPRYDLETLAVHPSHQGKGYGSLLVQWGVDRAIEERVPATVISADGTEKFYGRWFGRSVGKVTGGVGNPLEGIRGGVILD
ncbi:hypothetical protein FKW77_006302 [Venturia effusa]|uniref:N-acetyltransferase domain-containing protein n=1 Tax=Venturia effusa TaxID=50376 RepID=A0A517L5K8_9PEZI|nr:hypothetical protein FKW77_006302 [Venturia effusa]